MDGFVGLLIVLGIGLFISGPVAVVLAIVLFNKLGGINRRLNKLEGKAEFGSYDVIPTNDVIPTKPASDAPKPTTPAVAPVQCPAIEPKGPSQAISQPMPTVVSKPPETPTTPPRPSYTPPKPQPTPEKAAPATELAAAIKEFVPH
jgi:hypothetical protein